MSKRIAPVLALSLLFLLAVSLSLAQTMDVSAEVKLVRPAAAKAKKAGEASANVVLWLTPLEGRAALPIKPGRFRLLQKDKKFTPHLLVIPVGSLVDFPNEDPFFHNVFSFFNGKRFDLGLYESGSNRSVRFDHEGVDYIFCNIHSEMSAVVIALSTPYFAVSNREGVVTFHNVPPGSYELRVWAEGAQQEDLNALTRRVHVDTAQTNLGILRVQTTGQLGPHKNKFGEDYSPADVHPY